MEEQPCAQNGLAKYGSTPGQLSPQPDKVAKVKYTSKQWMTLITLAFGNFCSGACVSLQAPFFPAEAEKKGSTPTEYGFIFGIYSLTIFVTSPIIGRLVAYVSPKVLLNIGYLTIGITCIAFGALDYIEDSSTFVTLAFVIRTVEGIGGATVRTSCYTIIAVHFSEGLGTTFAVLQTFVGVGLIIGPTLGGALYDFGGYGLPFYVTGGLILVDAVVIFFVLTPVEMKKLPEKGNLLKFWLHPTTLVYALSVFTTFNYIGFNTVSLEPHLRQFKLSGFVIGTFFAISGTVYAVTSPMVGWIVDKKGRHQYLCLTGSLIAVVSINLIGPAPFINLKPKIWMIATALVLMGLSCGLKIVCAFTGTLKTTLKRGFPPDLSTYGLVSSMMASFQSLGAFAGPSSVGYLLDHHGYRNASMYVFMLETIVIVLLSILIFKNKICRSTASISFKEQPMAPMENGPMFSEKNGICKKISN